MHLLHPNAQEYIALKLLAPMSAPSHNSPRSLQSHTLHKYITRHKTTLHYSALFHIALHWALRYVQNYVCTTMYHFVPHYTTLTLHYTDLYNMCKTTFAPPKAVCFTALMPKLPLNSQLVCTKLSNTATFCLIIAFVTNTHLLLTRFAFILHCIY